LPETACDRIPISTSSWWPSPFREAASLARVASALTKARRHGATTRLSPIVRTFDELGQGGFLIFDIACDGRVVFDPEGAVTNYLAQVRDRLERRGAKRQTASGDRYWVLEPDVRPGDIVVL
jgi:hypothetical protein